MSDKNITLPAALVFRAFDVLRLAHIYALKDSHPEELPEDFKPHKWDGHEIEFAKESVAVYQEMVAVAYSASEHEPDNVPARLEYLRGELRAERISLGELVELQSLAPFIPEGDVELLEAAGVPEHAEDREES